MAAPVTWTLKVGDVTKTLAAWGITSPRLTFRSLDTDEFSAEIRGDVTAAPPFAYGASVDLYRNGVRWFSGTVTSVRAFGRARSQGWAFTAANAWWQLARVMYQQDIAHYNDACAWIGSSKSTKVVLFSSELSGAAITTGEQISAAIAYALTRGVLLVAGAVPAFVNVPSETARELTVADVIRRALQVTPDAVTWCDYTGGVPVLHCQQRALLDDVALDLGAIPALVSEFDLRRRDDLVPPGVRLNYVSSVLCTVRVPVGCVDPSTGIVNTGPATVDSAQPVELLKLTQDGAGAPDDVGGLIGTVDLPPGADGAAEPAPIGLAAEYFATLATAPWEGSLVLRERHCSGLVRPGKVLNLAGGNAQWATMRALVQEVTESLDTGETVVTFGPPAHLGPQDFVAQTQFTRRRPWVQDAFAVTRPPGTPETPNCHAGLKPATKELLDRLARSGRAAAHAIGGDNIGDELSEAMGGPLGTVELELCDPPGSTVTVYAPSGG